MRKHKTHGVSEWTKAIRQRDALAGAILELIESGYVIHFGEAQAKDCPGCRIDKVLIEMGRLK